MNQNDGTIFSTFRQVHRCLSEDLEERLRPVNDLLRTPGLLDFDRTDDELVAMLWEKVGPIDPPRVVSVGKRSPIEINYFNRSGFRYTVVVSIEGNADLVEYWPDEIGDVTELATDPPQQETSFDAEPPIWNLSGRELVFRIEYLQSRDQLPPDVPKIIDDEIDRVQAIIAAIATQIVLFTRSAARRIQTAVAERRRSSEIGHGIHEAIRLPAYSPLLLRIEECDEEDVEHVGLDVHPLPPRMVVRDDDWSTYLGVIRRWASVASRNSAAFRELNEYALRDLLLASLNCVYPVALGEVMTRGKKSDIFVIPDPDHPELKPIITELKIWGGAATVASDLDQHLGQLTVRETRGAIVYFFKLNSVEEPKERMRKAVELCAGFQGWTKEATDDVWPEAEFVSSQLLGHTVWITFADVFLEAEVNAPATDGGYSAASN